MTFIEKGGSEESNIFHDIGTPGGDGGLGPGGAGGAAPWLDAPPATG